MQSVDMREKQLNIRLSEEEAARFERVAAHYGLNVAAAIRMLFKREDDRILRGQTTLEDHGHVSPKQAIGTILQAGSPAKPRKPRKR